MALSLSTPDGEEVEVSPVEIPEDVKAASDAFNRAQANSPVADERMRPPKRAAQAADVQADERPRRGRPRKDERARTTSQAPAAGKPIPPKDYRADLNATADGLWLGLSQIPYTAPYAAVVHANQSGLVESLNAGAQVNQGVRNFVEKLTSGTGNAWVLQGAVVGMNIGMQCWAVYRDPTLRAQVAEANKARVQEYVEAISGAQLPVGA